MKFKTIKTRNKFGQVEYVEAIDTDGIIAVTRELLKANPKSKRAKEFIQWIDSLGHKPTADEFERWSSAHGIPMKPLNAEDYEN